MVNRHLFLVLWLSLIVGSLGCAGPSPANPAVSAGHPAAHLASMSADAHAPGFVFPTVEAAVRDAFEAAEGEARPSDRGRLRIGTIRRVEGGFVWTDPVRSRGAVGAREPLQARIRLGAEDVAVYSVHPRSGILEVDRLNEAVAAGERRLVDLHDPLHRPVFVQTPSRRILRYPEPARSLEIVRGH